jgi:hypothetical protein
MACALHRWAGCSGRALEGCSAGRPSPRPPPASSLPVREGGREEGGGTKSTRRRAAATTATIVCRPGPPTDRLGGPGRAKTRHGRSGATAFSEPLAIRRERREPASGGCAGRGERPRGRGREEDDHPRHQAFHLVVADAGQPVPGDRAAGRGDRQGRMSSAGDSAARPAGSVSRNVLRTRDGRCLGQGSCGVLVHGPPLQHGCVGGASGRRSSPG